MRREYLKLRLKKYLVENKVNSLDVILDLIGDREGYESVKLVGKISQDLPEISDLCGISERTIYRTLQRRGERLGDIMVNYQHGNRKSFRESV